MTGQKDSLEQQIEEEELSKKVSRQGKGRGLVIGTIIAAAIAGAALAEHYTGFVGKGMETGKETVLHIGRKAGGAYDGALTLISDLRSTEAKREAATRFLRDAPPDVRLKAAIDIYRSMGQEEKEACFGRLTQDERYGHAMAAYSALDKPLRTSFDMETYASKTPEDRLHTIESIISGMPADEAFAAHEEAFSRLPEERKYEAVVGQSSQLGAKEMRQLMRTGAKGKFKGPDYAEALAELYHDSDEAFGNGGEIAGEILGKHASGLAERIKRYAHDLMK